jgi:hypothetical protein
MYFNHGYKVLRRNLIQMSAGVIGDASSAVSAK